jgi:hypothetical protein
MLIYYVLSFVKSRSQERVRKRFGEERRMYKNTEWKLKEIKSPGTGPGAQIIALIFHFFLFSTQTALFIIRFS